MVAEWITTLAAAGGTTLVAAVATDTWTQAKTRFARLFGRGDARREDLAAGRLEATATEITAAADPQAARAAHLAIWTSRLADLLEEDPDAADELRTATAEVTAALPAAAQTWIQVTRSGAAYATGGGVATTGVVMGNITTTGQ